MTGQRAHPYNLLFGLIAWVVIVYQAHDLFTTTVCLVAAFSLHLMDRREPKQRLIRLLLTVVPLMTIYVLVTATMSATTDGGHVIWQGPRILHLATLEMTTGSLNHALQNAFRLWSLLLGALAITRLIRPDDVILWLGRRFAGSGLTIAMIINFLPLMQREFWRLREYVWLRGRLGQQTTWLRRIRASGAVLQALLMNALDRSWVLAESMYVRGYGQRGRTFYRRAAWRTQDTSLLTGWLLAIVLAFVVHGTRYLFLGDVLLVLVCLFLMGGVFRVHRHD